MMTAFENLNFGIKRAGVGRRLINWQSDLGWKYNPIDLVLSQLRTYFMHKF